MNQVVIKKPVMRHTNLDRLLMAAVFVGAGLWLYSFLPFQYSGNARLIGPALVGIAFTVVWPEFALVVLGGSIGHSEFLLSPLRLPYSGVSFVTNALMLLAGAGFILVQRSAFRLARPRMSWPFAFILVLTVWILFYAAIDYVWIAKSLILNYYLISGVFSGLILWYLVFSQTSDVVRSGQSLLWATLVANVGGLVVNMLVTAGSLAPLLNPYSSFWTIGETSGRLSFGGFNENAIAVELLAPPVIVAFAFLFSSRTGVVFKAAIIGLVAILSVLIVATGTRQAVLGGGVALITIILLADRKQLNRSVVGIALGSVVAILVVSEIGTRFSVAGGESIAGLLSPGSLLTSDETVIRRLVYVARDIDAFLQNPLFGQGLGFGSVNNLLGNAASHNVLTSIAVEVGVVPLLTTVGFLGAVFRAVWQIVRTHNLSAEERVVLQGLTGLFMLSLVALMISGRMEGGYWFFGYGVALYFMAGVLRERSREGPQL
ncbi:MAG: O-antigen ligase family protein [Nitrospirae bacterium]|nr:O-antigen ligase family protein [Nitrospirota bacterium]